MKRAKVEISGNFPVLCGNKGKRRHGCIPEPELVYARVNPVVVNDRPGSAPCSKETVGMANMTMNECEILSSTLARCPVER